MWKSSVRGVLAKPELRAYDCKLLYLKLSWSIFIVVSFYFVIINSCSICVKKGMKPFLITKDNFKLLQKWPTLPPPPPQVGMQSKVGRTERDKMPIFLLSINPCLYFVPVGVLCIFLGGVMPLGLSNPY